MADMHLTLTLRPEEKEIVVRGDTYGARTALKQAGYRACKRGEWEWVRTFGSIQDAMAAIQDLGRELYRLALPVLERHYAAAAAGGYRATPELFAWVITVVAGSREAHYICVAESLTPASYQNGRWVPAA